MAGERNITAYKRNKSDSHPCRLTTLDIMLATHILVILKPPFPDKLLSDLLADSYPTLVSHAERILERSLQSPAPMHSSLPGHSLLSLFPPWTNDRAEKSEGQAESHHDSNRWGWVSLAVGSVGLYWMARVVQ
jgi:sorting and assembly machinery component 37